MSVLKIALRRGCALLIGNLSDLPLHTHAAAAICAGLDRPLSIRGSADAEWRRCSSVLVPAGVSNELAIAHCRFAVLYMDPGSEIFARMFGALQTSEYTNDPPGGADLLEAFREIDQKPFAECPALFGRLLARYVVREHAPLDDRLMHILERLVHTPEESTSIEELAASIQMSPSWLHHAFKAHLGIPLRRFRVWFRLKATVQLIRRGLGPADAAIASGFFDQSHFITTFRDMFGLTPGVLFTDPSKIQWDIENESLTERLLDPRSS